LTFITQIFQNVRKCLQNEHQRSQFEHGREQNGTPGDQKDAPSEHSRADPGRPSIVFQYFSFFVIIKKQ